MLSTVPAMSSRMGSSRYRQRNAAVSSRQSGLSSYILISCPMMPCSLAMVSLVNQGLPTMFSRMSRFSSMRLVAENR